ncbi:SDR family oxidoreductase [Photobacterium lutimaris]|uniref:Oxidoreductase n=1 Tax=Photobacterium lutimaris TaxID=388278 RepID=A0A2T3IXW6_9GAMM|nr:SDR family oxidoreductase [Photobacterium lutimaris]PSU33380.1 oxidoreductase [Photobacterium lutimaris]TDR75024.1 NADP-dependent 3-hydroxy acid dehydrogenase YdfG [Photobacterium lutimaris]
MIAVVTGATSGIGKAITHRLLARGECVVAAGRTARQSYLARPELLPVNCDLLEDDAVERLFQQTMAEYGNVDLLFVNAGVIESGPIETINIDKVCEMTRLKVESSFRLIYTFAKYFKEKNKGHIFITSSVLGTKTRENSGAYAGCNFALEALAESLRMELAGTNVQITCIEPGLVQTNLHAEWEVHPKHLLNISDTLQPEDIADAIIDVLEKPSHVRVPKVMLLPKGHKI